MTITQENMLYEYLDDASGEVTLREITASLHLEENRGALRLSNQVAQIINHHRLAFETGRNTWITRRGLFEKGSYLITPTRNEIQNGVIIPGHRCVPFANPEFLPKDLQFFFNDKLCPITTSEGDPDDFYPYFALFGEEYAPHYVARDNPENEAAYNNEFAEEPGLVSLKTIDMRSIYRTLKFSPGDSFVVTVRDWGGGSFNLEYKPKDTWLPQDADSWIAAAEKGFFKSFEKLGALSSSEEQIAWAYFYGGERLLRLPSIALESFLYEKTDKIETVPFGIESRFWFAGKDIPDYKKLTGVRTQSDQTPIEELLERHGVPVSEFVVQSYVRDALHRELFDPQEIFYNIVPKSITMDKWSSGFIMQYIVDILREFGPSYSVFKDKRSGMLRERLTELHTAVVDLAARITQSEINRTWLPLHTFVVLSQVETHTAGMLEDLNAEDNLIESEEMLFDNSIDSMYETYEDLRELIDTSIENFRYNNFSLVKSGDEKKNSGCVTLQVSLGGTDIWRRLEVPADTKLSDLARILHIVFNWPVIPKSREALSQIHTNFVSNYIVIPGIVDDNKVINNKHSVGLLRKKGLNEFFYEHGQYWVVRVLSFSKQEAQDIAVRCIAGEGKAPPFSIEGPLRFRRLLGSIAGGNREDREAAQAILGKDFDGNDFDIGQINKELCVITGEDI
jgi:hypothetical protein